ncbi:MAG TPA: methyltransferase domain-containing protein [Vicinamibacterales bacterium]|nr:methyltransferase domain-containing protein [Vicinamibacterales bacterium]
MNALEVRHAGAGSGGRLRYDAAHWAREEDHRKALDQYLRLGEKAYNRTKCRLFSALAGDLRGKTILDYGGGAGILAVPFAKAGASVVIVDAERNALLTAAYYARREGVEQRVATVESESFPSELKRQRFDLVLAKDIIEHIPDDQRFVDDLAQCQARGGVLLLSTHNNHSLNYAVEGTYQRRWLGNREWCGWDPTHVRFYNAPALRRILRHAGYRPNRWASAFVVPYNLPSWLLLHSRSIEFPAFSHFDLTLGRVFPFNRLGWNVIVRAVKL